MSSAFVSFKKPEVWGYSNRKAGYHPARARNLSTGQIEEVVLVEPRKLEKLAVVDSFPELRLDLHRALSKFSRPQRRVLFKVLVQGQSVELATRGLQRTSRWWHNWLNKTALPQLRESLSDYVENGKVVV